MLKVAPRTYGHKSKFFRFDGYDYLYAARAASPAINYLPRALTSLSYTLVERYLRQHTRARNHQFETSLTRLEEVLCGCVISNSRVYGSGRWGDILGRRRRQSGRGGAKSCLVLEIVCFQQFSNNPAKGKFVCTKYENIYSFIYLPLGTGEKHCKSDESSRLSGDWLFMHGNL